MLKCTKTLHELDQGTMITLEEFKKIGEEFGLKFVNGPTFEGVEKRYLLCLDDNSNDTSLLTYLEDSSYVADLVIEEPPFIVTANLREFKIITGSNMEEKIQSELVNDVHKLRNYVKHCIEIYKFLKKHLRMMKLDMEI